MDEKFLVDIMNISRVTLLLNDNGLVHLIIQSKNAKYVSVLTIHQLADCPSYFSIPNVDLFQNHSQALKSIATIFGSKIIADAIALIGMVKEDDQMIFGFITEQICQCQLPGKIPINIIKSTQFISIKGNQVSLETPYNDFPLEDYHYYAEFFDITRPFPSSTKWIQPDNEFCWNTRWREPFVKGGAPEACVVLLQGTVTTTMLSGHSISFLIKRSALNPGVRYFARGINEDNEPGNECECEFIFASPNGDVRTQIYRRGSIPIKWETVVKNKMTVHHIVTDQSSAGTKQYFKRIQEKYHGAQTFCISLLRASPDSSEHELFDAFKKVCNDLRTTNSVRLITFDLNHFLDNGGHVKAVSELCSLLGPLAKSSDFTFYVGLLKSDGTLKSDIEPSTRQTITLRFNCADSLDRTNVAAFVYSCAITELYCMQQKLLNPSDDFSLDSIKEINPELIEYLADAYVKSGDVISMLYTNTVAAKTNIIRKYSPLLDEASSDASISVKRRIFNMVSDPQRQVLFEKWNSHEIIGSNFVLDHTKIHMMSQGFPQDILNLSNAVQNDVITTVHTSFSILLPYGTIITALYYFATPSTEKNHPVSLFIQGEEKSRILAVNLPIVDSPSVVRIPIEGFSDRMLDFIFMPQDHKISVGRFLIEAKRVTEVYHYQIESSQHEDGLNTYKEFIQTTIQEIGYSFIASQDIEHQRLRMCLSNDDDMKLKLSIPQNPYKINHIYEYSSKCLMCGQESNNKDFAYSDVIPTRITNASPDSINFVNICDKCIQNAKIYCVQTDMLISTRFTKIHLENPTVYSNFIFSMPIKVSQMPEAFLIGAPNKLLMNATAVDIKKELRFTIVFTHRSELEHFEFNVSQYNRSVSITIYAGNQPIQLLAYEKEGNIIWAGLQNQIVAHTVDILIKTGTPIKLTGLAVFGIPVEKLPEKNQEKDKELSASSSMPFPTGIIERVTGNSNLYNADRISIHSSVKRIAVMVSVNPKVQNNNALIAFYDDKNNLLLYNQMTIARLTIDKKLIYIFDVPDGTKYARAFSDASTIDYISPY